MEEIEECSFVRLLPDGSPVVSLRGRETVVDLYGIEIVHPTGDLYREIFLVRIPQARKPLRCKVHAVLPGGNIRTQLFCFGWQDKSGDVWLDLAVVLLREGLARVAPGEFPEREQYLEYEREVKSGEREES